MSTIFATRGLFTLVDAAINAASDIRQAVFTGTVPAAATIRDWNTLADVIADPTSAESVAAGYARADLAAPVLTENDGTDNVTITVAAYTYLAVAAGETWTFAAHYVEAATDATRTLISIDNPPAQITFGGNITGPALAVTVAPAVGN